MRKTSCSKKVPVLLTNELLTVLQRVARRQKKKPGTVLWESFQKLNARTEKKIASSPSAPRNDNE